MLWLPLPCASQSDQIVLLHMLSGWTGTTLPASRMLRLSVQILLWLGSFRVVDSHHNHNPTWSSVSCLCPPNVKICSVFHSAWVCGSITKTTNNTRLVAPQVNSKIFCISAICITFKCCHTNIQVVLRQERWVGFHLKPCQASISLC